MNYDLIHVSSQQSYERLKQGEFEEIQNFEGIGRLFVALQISLGLSQRELAERLGVYEFQVSRDERNEYHGITLERAGRPLDALGADTLTTVIRLGKETSKRKAVESRAD